MYSLASDLFYSTLCLWDLSAMLCIAWDHPFLMLSTIPHIHLFIQLWLDTWVVLCGAITNSDAWNSSKFFYGFCISHGYFPRRGIDELKVYLSLTSVDWACVFFIKHHKWFWWTTRTKSSQSLLGGLMDNSISVYRV